MRRVSVIGSGSWGTAASGLVAPRVDECLVWCRSEEVARGINEGRHNPRHLTDYEVAPGVRATTSREEACAGAEAIVLAVPSAFLRSTCSSLRGLVGPDTPLLVLTKGVEDRTCELMGDVVSDELGNPGRIAVLSGPNHAEEICRGTISAAVVASQSKAVAEGFQRLLVNPAFRVYVTGDLTGVEVCGAAKNVIAIACGIAVGLGAGDNTLAVLMTRGLAEIGRIAVAVGGDSLTCMGLAGMGDLVATCTSRHSRNRTFGEAFVAGETLEQYQARTHMVVEGAVAARSVSELAHAHGVESPITDAVNGILYEGKPLAHAIDALLGRPSHDEFYGFGTNE